MAIDDNTSYELTGAQVKDLAARIKGAAGAVIYYVGETFFTDGATGESVYSDSALTTTVTATAMAAEAEAGKLLYLFELDSRDDVVSIHEISYVAPPGMDDGEFSVLYGTSIWDIFYVPGTGWSVNEQPIPTVNNATLTIQHNGTTVNTFTANASTNKTADVETIWADPIASSAAITPLVQTSMIADGAVTADKLGASSVTPAKIDWSEFPKFNAYYNTSYNGFPADTPIPFNTQQINVGGFTLSNGRITIPKTGNYMITVQLWVHNNNDRSWWKLRRNGLAINEAIFEATGYWGLTAFSCAYVCSQGDIIDVIKNGGESVNLNSGSGDKRSTSITIQYIG